jgi:hypothetical protein
VPPPVARVTAESIEYPTCHLRLARSYGLFGCRVRASRPDPRHQRAVLSRPSPNAERSNRPAVRRGTRPVVLARSFPEEGDQTAGGASACGFGCCTDLYAAVRRIGGMGGPAHVHIADSVAAADIT